MSSKKYANYKEDFKTEKKRKKIALVRRWTISLVITCGVAVYLLFFMGLFDVRSVDISSTTLIPAEQVEVEVWRVLDATYFGIPRKRNSILFSPHGIESELLKAFPRIDSVNVRRESLHSFSVHITERVPVGLWCLTKRAQCFYYDIDGIAFSNVASSSGYLFVAMNDGRDREISLNEKVEDNHWREHLQDVKKILQFGGIRVKSFSIKAEAPDEFSVTTGEGWNILYVNDSSVRAQTNALLAFLKETLSAKERSMLDYVDLRIEDRIYYKTKE